MLRSHRPRRQFNAKQNHPIVQALIPATFRRTIYLEDDIGNSKMSAYETYVTTRGMHAPPRRSSALIAQEDFASRNEDWKKIQQIVISLFQKKGVRGYEILSVSKNLNAIIDSPGGKFLKEYYNDILLIRGIVILREPLRALNGAKLINEITATWKYFFAEILPSLSAIFYKIESKSMPIRTLTLKAFKDLLIFKLPNLLDTFEKEKRMVENDVDLRHMLLMLQTATDKTAPDLRLQQLLTFVVNPYLGQAGLFMGPGDPIIRAPIRKKSSPADEASKTGTIPKHQTGSHRPTSTPAIMPNAGIGYQTPPARRSMAATPLLEEDARSCSPSNARQKSMPDLPKITSEMNDSKLVSMFSFSGIPAINVEWTESASGQLQRDIRPMAFGPMDFSIPSVVEGATSVGETKTSGKDAFRQQQPHQHHDSSIGRTPAGQSNGSSGKSAEASGRRVATNAALDTLIECGSGDEMPAKERHYTHFFL